MNNENITQTVILIKNGKYIEYYNNGINIYSESYYVNNQLHRDGNEGPAYIYYFHNGNIFSKSYYQHNKLHRCDGPAEIYYYYDKNVNKSVINFERYFVNGIEYTDDLCYCVAVGCYLGDEKEKIL